MNPSFVQSPATMASSLGTDAPKTSGKTCAIKNTSSTRTTTSPTPINVSSPAPNKSMVRYRTANIHDTQSIVHLASNEINLMPRCNTEISKWISDKEVFICEKAERPVGIIQLVHANSHPKKLQVASEFGLDSSLQYTERHPTHEHLEPYADRAQPKTSNISIDDSYEVFAGNTCVVSSSERNSGLGFRLLKHAIITKCTHVFKEMCSSTSNKTGKQIKDKMLFVFGTRVEDELVISIALKICTVLMDSICPSGYTAKVMTSTFRRPDGHLARSNVIILSDFKAE